MYEPQRYKIAYVVCSREDFEKWRVGQPDGVRYTNVWNYKIAEGLIHLFPPARFVVLPSADTQSVMTLKRKGFSVDFNNTPEQKRIIAVNRYIASIKGYLDEFEREHLLYSEDDKELKHPVWDGVIYH